MKASRKSEKTFIPLIKLQMFTQEDDKPKQNYKFNSKFKVRVPNTKLSKLETIMNNSLLMSEDSSR